MVFLLKSVFVIEQFLGLWLRLFLPLKQRLEKKDEELMKMAQDFKKSYTLGI